MILIDMKNLINQELPEYLLNLNRCFGCVPPLKLVIKIQAA
jgi:hypothetical protein